MRLSRTDISPNTWRVWNVRADPAALELRGAEPVMSSPLNSHAARRSGGLAEDAVEQRGLAGAVGPDHAEDLAGRGPKLTPSTALMAP